MLKLFVDLKILGGAGFTVFLLDLVHRNSLLVYCPHHLHIPVITERVENKNWSVLAPQISMDRLKSK